MFRELAVERERSVEVLDRLRSRLTVGPFVFL